MSTQREAFDRAIVAWNSGDLDRYLELYDEDIELHGYSDQPLGKSEVREYYRTIFAALSHNVLEIHSVIEDGVQIGCRFTMHGTHTGEIAGIAPTGRRVTQPGITILVFAGDRVISRYSVADFAAVVAQLTA